MPDELVQPLDTRTVQSRHKLSIPSTQRHTGTVTSRQTESICQRPNNTKKEKGDKEKNNSIQRVTGEIEKFDRARQRIAAEASTRRRPEQGNQSPKKR